VASLDKTFDADAPLGTEWDGAALVGDCFFIKENQKLKKVAFKDIAWMEADGNYTMIQTTERKYALKKSLVSVKSQLPPDKFIQIQKGCVVRLAAIDSIDIGQGTVKVGQVDLPLGKTFKDDLLLHFKRV
jgi:DNA-binding LytR/AlgR family response regulator